jgi:hypothetical protein
VSVPPRLQKQARDGAETVHIELRPVTREMARERARDTDQAGLSAVAAVLAQIPDPDGLAPGTLVVVGDAPKGGALWRLFSEAWPEGWRNGWRRATSVRTEELRRTRASALLARGYVEIEAGRDETGADLVWGLTSPGRPSPGR